LKNFLLCRRTARFLKAISERLPLLCKYAAALRQSYADIHAPNEKYGRRKKK
jgi:hypothetical protein